MPTRPLTTAESDGSEGVARAMLTILPKLALVVMAMYFRVFAKLRRPLTIACLVVLLGVGIWMHLKSMAGRWQAYLKERLSAALTKKSAFFLFALAFVAVYREVFETILFYIALWTRGNGLSIVGGLAAGVAALGVIMKPFRAQSIAAALQLAAAAWIGAMVLYVWRFLPMMIRPRLPAPTEFRATIMLRTAK